MVALVLLAALIVLAAHVVCGHISYPPTLRRKARR